MAGVEELEDEIPMDVDEVGVTVDIVVTLDRLEDSVLERTTVELLSMDDSVTNVGEGAMELKELNELGVSIELDGLAAALEDTAAEELVIKEVTDEVADNDGELIVVGAALVDDGAMTEEIESALDAEDSLWLADAEESELVDVLTPVEE
ncbi:hypothetical protein T440DRAFT_553376 [Plenodomus tracheiphilus IPT5]|uniref:Uncharacterized protein n=1 Tax=Plenodomus tracheiphilus IPT5 TaxID=1408161 RepID=A0A6A7BAT9_9PLEO|nr:hypothetical protein T440DRAFT_553376 [Plenodomus tracheiphilus IPT5]